MPTLDIVPLRSFVAVASFASVRGAAEALHLSPPAITRHIRKLEQELECRLVVPQGRGITLSSDGEELALRARDLLQKHDDTVTALSRQRSGELLVAATEIAAEFLVPPAISILTARLPERQVQLRLTRSTHVRNLVDDQRADIALLLSGPIPGSTEIATIPLQWVGTDTAARDELVVFTAPCAVRQNVITALAGHKYKIVQECGHLGAVLAAARTGTGITALPRLGPNPDGLRPVPGMPPIAHVTLFMATSTRIGASTHAAVANELRAMIADTEPTIA